MRECATVGLFHDAQFQGREGRAGKILPIVHDLLRSVQERGLVDIATEGVPVIPAHLGRLREAIVRAS